MKTAMRGFNARAEPSRTETMFATYARDTAMPSSAKALKNPMRPRPDLQHEAMAHFADHCAVCHGNNGSGQTMFGKGMYPKPPDLRLSRTQDMTDGEIFYVIENGIRMSGMPAFGGEATDSADDTWKLVYFIRHLPQLTPAEEAQMDSLSPKSPDEFEEEKQEQQFLNDGESPTETLTMHHRKGHDQ
ncbi:MAG: cbb3-type cytochrome c oxidase subunit [Edaphobacter sp.]|nr:cbb3-type cytochrome c oxidase subunit [Edaphobacter sp.]